MDNGSSPIPAPAARMTPIVRSFDARDIDHLMQAFLNWDQRFEQIGHGAFRGRICVADFGGVQLLDTDVNLTIRTRGARMADSFTFSPIDSANADSTWRGRVLRPGMVNVACPQHEMDHRTNPDYRHTAITVHRDVLEGLSATLLGVDVLTLLGSDQAPQVDGTLLKALRRRWQANLMLLATDVGPEAQGAVALNPQELVADLLRTLAAGRIVDPYRITPADRRRVVRAAEEYALSASPATVTVLQLCRLTGVSERTLHYAFSELTGLSPMAYLKTLRLNHARKDLLRSSPDRGRIDAVARRHGFNRPGMFAADYQRLFGMLPSQALGQRRP